MNSTYYVAVPGSDFPTAETEASSTKHARTAYLDYLSRNNYIGWGDRQAWRQKIVTKRMQPGEIRTQVLLDYDGKSIVEPETEIEAPGRGELVDPDRLEVVSEEQVEFDPETIGSLITSRGEYREDLPPRRPQQMQQGSTSVLPARGPSGDSPIAKLSKQSRGM